MVRFASDVVLLYGDAIYLKGESDRRERETWTGHNVWAKKEEAKDWILDFKTR